MTTKKVVQYAVIDDYGDDWKEGSIAFSHADLDECYEWAESENYHSASIVKIFEDGTRERVA